MDTKTIGTWQAWIDTTEGTILKVQGEFPTNGEKPGFRLEKADSPSINPTDNLLQLNFINVVEPNGNGTGQVFYSETLESADQFNTVSIVDLANGIQIKK